MKTLSKKIGIVLCVLACLCFGALAVSQMMPSETKVSASSESIASNPGDFKMIDAASIRLDAAKNGIRFATFIGDNSAQAGYDFVNNYELGTLFLPKAAMSVPGRDSELTIDGSYKGDIKPAKAVFDGDKTKLTRDVTQFGEGYVFNAVLDLSSVTGLANALNNTIVARSYVLDKTTGDVDYLDPIERAPAYVAAMELNDGKANSVLDTYVSKVEIEMENQIAGVGGTVNVVAKTNVEGIPVSISVAGETLVDGAYTPDKVGKVAAVASIGNGSITKNAYIKTFGEEKTFYNAYYTPEGDFVFEDAYNVNDVKVGGVSIDRADWSIDANDKLTVKKGAIVNKDTTESDVALTLSAVTDAEINVKAYKAELTSFGEGELGAEILGEMTSAGEVTANASAGTISIPVQAKTGGFTRVALHEDYTKAMFAYPDLNNLTIEIKTPNANGNYGYVHTLASSGSVANASNSGAQSTAKKISYNRVTFNKLKELDELYTFGVTVGVQESESATIELHSIGLGNANDATASIYHVDNQLVDARGLNLYRPHTHDETLQYGSSSTPNTYPIAVQTYTKDGYVKVMPNGRTSKGINSSTKTAADEKAASRVQIGGSSIGFGWEYFFIYNETPIINDYQYVNKDTATSYEFPFTVGEGEKIESVLINGEILDMSVVTETGIALTKDMIKALDNGHNALEIKVGRTFVNGTLLNTTIDTYYRSICAVTNSMLSNPITFEDGTFSPFVSISTGDNVKFVDVSTDTDFKAFFDSKDTDDYDNDYKKNKRYYIPADRGDPIENKMVMGVWSGATVYVSAYYIKARAEVLLNREVTSTVLNTGAMTSMEGIAIKAVKLAGGSIFMTVTYNGIEPKYDIYVGDYGNNGQNAGPLLSKEQYESMLEDGAPNNVSFTVIELTTGAGYIYFDDICSNITTGQFLAQNSNYRGAIAGISDQTGQTTLRLAADMVQLYP